MQAWGDATKSIASGIAASLVFLIFLFVLKAAFWLAAFMGVLVFVALLVMFMSFWGKAIDEKEAGVSSEHFAKLVGVGREQANQLERLAANIQHDAIAGHTLAIAALANAILNEIEDKPKKLKAARRFLSYYLDTTVRIVEMSADIADGPLTPEAGKSLSKMDGVLVSVKDTFEKQLCLIQRDDILNLDIEIEVLEKTIKLEGL